MLDQTIARFEHGPFIGLPRGYFRPRIELFAREQRPGWSAWGDQLHLNLFGGAA